MGAPRDIYRAFSGLLAYPAGSPAGSARECARLLAREAPAAARELEAFAATCERLPLARLEEAYTATFDLNPSCCPYVGYQLVGESYKRAELLVGLKRRYEEHGFSTGEELADHLSVVLGFVGSLAGEEALAAELIADAVLPAVRKMLGALDGGERPGGNPYRGVLAALLAFLETGAAEQRRTEGAGP